MRLIRMLLLAALACSPVFAHADDEAAVKRLTGLLDQAQTLSGRFSQLTLDGSGTQLQETSGQMALKRPGLFRWHTDAPQEQLLVSNGQKVWLYDPDLMQVTVQTLDQRIAARVAARASSIRTALPIWAAAGRMFSMAPEKTRSSIWPSMLSSSL